MNDLSNNFRYNILDATIAQRLLELEKTPEAIKYFSQVCGKLTDYSYWFLLSTLWVSYSGFSDLNLWKQLFNADRPKKHKSIMKPSEVKAFGWLPYHITAYRAHRSDEADWIAYTLNKSIAFGFAQERGMDEIREYRIKKRDVSALFLRRNEEEIILTDKEKADFIRTHIYVGNGISLSEHKDDDSGYVCMPLVSNIPQGHADWVLVNCPICGAECWETKQARQLLKNPNTKAACTLCSLKIGLEHGCVNK